MIHLSPMATKPVQMMWCCSTCHITRMPRDMPAFAGTACHVLVPVPCPWDRAGLPGLDELQMPERESRTRATLFPVLGCQSSQHCFSPKRFHSSRVPSFILTFQKIIVEMQGEERGRVSSNDMGTEAWREWGGGKLPMAHESHWLDDDLLCAAHHWSVWRAKPSSLLCGDNSSSGVIKTGPDHKSEWIKPLGKKERQKVQKFYISKDAGQKSPEGMGVLGHIYFCLPRCHCCRGGLLASFSMLTPSPGESNSSWLDGYQFAK